MIAVSVGVVLLLVLLALGLPVALTLAAAGSAGLYLLSGMDTLLGILTSTPLSSLQSYDFVAVPMFILMANFIIISGVSDDMFEVAKTWMGRVPGGLAHATALTGAAFGAISGSSTAAAATLSATSIPGMVKQGYDMRLAAGVAAISGTLAMLIPPSIAMVLYALIANMSVAKLLIAGIIPGLLVTLTIILTVVVLVLLNPGHAPVAKSYTLWEKIRSMRSAWTFIALFAVVSGSIYMGIATPTETSAMGALAAGLLAWKRKASLKDLRRAFVTAAEASCMIALVVIGAQVFGYFVTMAQVTQGLVTAVGAAGLEPWVVLLIVIVIYLILGCFIDLVTTLILTVPIVAPLMTSLGYDPIWFAVIVIVTCEVGMVTPPLGFNVFVISKYTGIPVNDVFRGSYPHVAAHILLIAVLCFFPSLVTWLPSTMK